MLPNQYKLAIDLYLGAYVRYCHVLRRLSKRGGIMGRKSYVFKSEIETAEKIWGCLSQAAMNSLRALMKRFGISVLLGHVQYIDGRWYITHSGLLQIAQRRRCSGIQTSPLTKFCDPVTGRWVFRATVFKSPRSKGFVGYGDADPSNTSPLVRGAEMRVAETRAVNRALRKAYGIGLCSIEELRSFSTPSQSFRCSAAFKRTLQFERIE